MTILNNGTRNQYTATSGQTVFTYTFEIFTVGDLAVYANDTRLSEGTDYTVTGVEAENGGTIILTNPAVAGVIYTLFRDAVPERTTNYQTSGEFLEEEVDNDFDRIWAIIQQLISDRDRTFTLSQTTTSPLPLVIDEPSSGGFLRYKSDLSGIENVPLSELGDVSTASDLFFDDTPTNIVASNVQDAIAELDNRVVNVAYVDLFGGDIAAAVNALPAEGGTVYFGVGVYTSPYTSASNIFTRDNVSFVGSGRPDFNSGYTALEGGTVIQGTFYYQSNNTTFKNLGIDVGSDVCATLFSGVAQEGLFSGTPSQHQTNNRIENVAVLAQSFNAPIHAVLFERQDGGYINDLTTVYGASGLVLKAKNCKVDGVRSRSSANYTLLIKADAGGGVCENITLSNIALDSVLDESLLVAGDSANWDSNGLILLPTNQASVDYDVTNIVISNLVTRNTKTGFNCDTTAGGNIDNVSLNGFATDNHFFAGVSIEPNSTNVKISNGTIKDADYTVLMDGENNTMLNVSCINSLHSSFLNTGSNNIFADCTSNNPALVGFENTTGSCTVRTPTYIGLGSEVLNNSGSMTIEDISDLNERSAGILSYLQRQLITDIEAISGVGSIVSAWFGTSDPSSQTMSDLTGANNATFRDSSLAAKSIGSASALGLGNNINFDSNTVWDVDDDDSLSFGDGATDSPFSVMSLTKALVNNIGQIAAKFDQTAGSEQREWYLQLTSSSGLYMGLYDNSTGGHITRRYSGTLTPYNNLWTKYAGTYDGSGLASGIEVYIDGSPLANSDLSSGAYTAMENTTAKVASYNITTGGIVDNELFAENAVTLIFNVELSAANVSAIGSLLDSYYDL